MANYELQSIKNKPPMLVQPEVMPPTGEEGEYTNQIRFLKKRLLDKLSKLKYAAPFMQPVNTKGLLVRDYYDVIKNPMDLGTICLRVKNRYYCSVDDLISDVQLVIKNCFTYNPPETTICSHARKLQTLLHKVVQNLPAVDEMESESSLLRRQCRTKLKDVTAQLKELDPDTRDYLKNKWDALIKKMNKGHIKSMIEFDNRVSYILKQTHHKSKRIFEEYMDECEDEDLNEDNVFKVFGSGLWTTCNASFSWKICVISALDKTLEFLNRDLDTCVPGDEAEREDEKKISEKKLEEKSEEKEKDKTEGDVKNIVKDNGKEDEDSDSDDSDEESTDTEENKSSNVEMKDEAKNKVEKNDLAVGALGKENKGQDTKNTCGNEEKQENKSEEVGKKEGEKVTMEKNKVESKETDDEDTDEEDSDTDTDTEDENKFSNDEMKNDVKNKVEKNDLDVGALGEENKGNEEKQENKSEEVEKKEVEKVTMEKNKVESKETDDEDTDEEDSDTDTDTEDENKFSNDEMKNAVKNKVSVEQTMTEADGKTVHQDEKVKTGNEEEKNTEVKELEKIKVKTVMKQNEVQSKVTGNENIDGEDTEGDSDTESENSEDSDSSSSDTDAEEESKLTDDKGNEVKNEAGSKTTTENDAANNQTDEKVEDSKQMDGKNTLMAEAEKGIEECMVVEENVVAEEKSKTVDSRKMKEQSYTEAMLQILVNTSMITETLKLKTKVESSDDEDDEDKKESSPNIVGVDERYDILHQMNELPAESMLEIMHLVQQSEYDNTQNTDGTYNVMYFKKKSVNLMRTAIERSIDLQNKANLRAIKHAEKQNVKRSLEQYKPRQNMPNYPYMKRPSSDVKEYSRAPKYPRIKF